LYPLAAPIEKKIETLARNFTELTVWTLTAPRKVASNCSQTRFREIAGLRCEDGHVAFR